MKTMGVKRKYVGRLIRKDIWVVMESLKTFMNNDKVVWD